MTTDDRWRRHIDRVRFALDQRSAPDATVRLWLRDDDAAAPTPLHAAYFEAADALGAAPLIAVIPKLMTSELAATSDNWPKDARVAVHGWSHINRATSGAKKSEFPDAPPDAPPDTPIETVNREVAANDLARGQIILAEAFGTRALPVFVPPWNRIGARWAARLRSLGYAGLSTFAASHTADPPSGLTVSNTHVDVVDWRSGRVAKAVNAVATDLIAQVGTEPQRPIGILTHTLGNAPVPTPDAMMFLVQLTKREPRIQWIAPTQLFPASLSAT